MIAATFEIGPNTLAAVSVICSAIAALYARRTAKESRPNGGTSQRDAINRTEATVRALAEHVGVEHPAVGASTISETTEVPT